MAKVRFDHQPEKIKHLSLEVVDRYQSGRGCFAVRAQTEEPTAERSIRRLLMEAVVSFSNSRGPQECLVLLRS
jgi:hypothetical protein